MRERLGWAPLVVGAMLACIVLAAVHLIGMVARIAGVTSSGALHRHWYPVYFFGACRLF